MTDALEKIEPEPTPLPELMDLARVSLYAALTGAGAFIHVPVGPMHISLQTMFVMLAGFVLGPKRAALAMLVYVACGFIGLPMFGRGKAGPASFLGPTAGYYPGFIIGAVIAGFSVYITGSRRRRIIATAVCGFLGTATLLLIGAAVLRWKILPDWNRALMVGFFPFIVGDTIKMLAAVAVKEAFFPPKDRREGAV